MSDTLGVDFAGLDTTASRLRRAHGQMTSTAEHLEHATGAGREHWTGAASDASTRAQHEWTQSMNAQADALEQAALTLDRAVDLYRETERSVAARWE